MELLFLAILVLLMASALISGFPVAFALPGSAIITIVLAATSGYVFTGDVDSFFAHDGPSQWLTAGVTNFRSLYWDVERDTLIAIPLFIFMGIMLQRSKIAEDLLVSMAQLFGPVPGGLGISVVFVGALLAATTGIVGATVIAMGLISLPAMLRNNYSKPLATGTICASGTLGQIIPPSIVLIILVDQLSSAADQASTIRKAEYKEATGEFSMPGQFDVGSASAGDMFMGAFFPGMVLVGLYMLSILGIALIRPKLAPPVPFDGKYDWSFFGRVLLALFPPLALIFLVLGSIIMGVATVNQAGAIGAVGAMIMAGYRLREGSPTAFVPAILALISIAGIAYAANTYNLNVKNIQSAEDWFGIQFAIVSVIGLLIAVLWSAWRTFVVDDTLRGVMLETAKTTSMVFIILLGAAMLTAAFRAFGGEELVREFLTGLPGGFWGQFVVVMAVIFVLGFFLDFIEIAVVVVPIVAPILLADPGANVTAVWLGVMIGMNIQTSFLTPPFGFALFYLRGVAPPTVRTTHIYRGAAIFIFLQLVGLTITGFFPGLVNYLPNRVFLTSEVAPPPLNPRLQAGIEEHVFEIYKTDGARLHGAIDQAASLDLSSLPEDVQDDLRDAFASARGALTLYQDVEAAQAEITAITATYKPLHNEVRYLQRQIRGEMTEIEELQRDLSRRERDERTSDAALQRIRDKIAGLERELRDHEAAIPERWESENAAYMELAATLKKARIAYNRAADDAYAPVMEVRGLLAGAQGLAELGPSIAALAAVIDGDAPEVAMESIKSVEAQLGDLNGVSAVKSPLSKARRALRGDAPDREKAHAQLQKSLDGFAAESVWRQKAQTALADDLAAYDAAIHDTIGLRQLPDLPRDIALKLADYLSIHRDISLNF